MLIDFRRLYSTRLLPIGLVIGVAVTPLMALGDESSTSNAVRATAFVPHILAYARQHNAAVPLDPHVFVQDPNAPDDNGPEGIHHTSGLRPARLADARTLPLYDAQGDPLSLNLAHWLSSKGTAESIQDDEGLHVRMRFNHLIPFGVYSIFLCKTAAGGFDMAPLHAKGGPNVFNADGDGELQATLPLEHELAENESLLLIYHSDNLDHSDQAGEFGVNAHVQLVLVRANVPAVHTEEPPNTTSNDSTPL